MNDFSQMQPPTFDSGFSGLVYERAPRWDAGVNWYEFRDRQWDFVRFFGPITISMIHWVLTKKGKQMPMLCRNFNMVENKFQEDGCPICASFDFANSKDDRIKRLSPKKTGYVHGIVRHLQQSGAPDEPWRPVKLTFAILSAIAKLRGLNKVEYQGMTYEVDLIDANYGMDVAIYYDSAQQDPQKRYQVVPGQQRTPLSATERAYLKKIYDFPSMIKYPDKSEVERIMVSQGYVIGGIANTTMGQPNPAGQMHIPPPIPGQETPAWAQQPAPSPISNALDVPEAVPSWMQSQPQPPVQQPWSPPVQQQTPPWQQAMPNQQPSWIQPPAEQPQATPWQSQQPWQPQSAPMQEMPWQQPSQPQQQPSQPQTPPWQQAAQAAQAVVSQPAGSEERKFAIKGKQLTQNEFQEAINEFASKKLAGSERGTLVQCIAECEYRGINVPRCFAQFDGAEFCMTCPVRRVCLQTPTK